MNLIADAGLVVLRSAVDAVAIHALLRRVAGCDIRGSA
jgi:hypothetical protein